MLSPKRTLRSGYRKVLFAVNRRAYSETNAKKVAARMVRPPGQVVEFGELKAVGEGCEGDVVLAVCILYSTLRPYIAHFVHTWYNHGAMALTMPIWYGKGECK